MPIVTLAINPDFNRTVLPRPTIISFAEAGPMALKRSRPPDVTKLPNWVAGIPESVHECKERFLTVKSISAFGIFPSTQHGDQ